MQFLGTHLGSGALHRVGALGHMNPLRAFSKEDMRSFKARGHPATGLLDGPDSNAVSDDDVRCLMLHPVGWPNHGPEIELYLAEEAIGLVKSMNWDVVKGPMWDPADQDNEDEG